MADTIEQKQTEQPHQPDRHMDWFLQQLVQFANDQAMSLGITLNVGGVIVSGTLIGGKRYFEGFANDFGEGLGKSELVDMVKQHFQQHGKIYDRPADETSGFDPSFIHLEGAKFFSPGDQPIPSNRGMFWRGKISSIDGFILGSLAAQ